MHVCPRQSILVALFFLTPLGGLQRIAGAQGVGTPYGTREPVPCPTDKSSTLSVDQAQKVFECGAEIVAGGYIYLIKDLKMQLGAPRQSNPGSDTYHDLDPNGPVYPARGTFTRYQCSRVFNIDADHTNVGKNCNAYPQPRAEGICYRTTFGDWACKLFDRVTDSTTATMHVPPPQ